MSTVSDARRSRRATVAGCALFFACALAVAVTGCVPRRAAPVAPPQEARPALESKPEPRQVPSIEEEVLTRETPPLTEQQPTMPGPGAEGAPASEPESLLTVIQPTTPPHVAAAIRLVQSAREEIADGDVDAAVESLERAITVDANNPYAYYFLAESYFARATYDQAVVFADKAALLSARIDPTWLSRSYCLQGRIFEASGRFADARASYSQALDADGQNRPAWEGLSRVGGIPPEQP